MIAQDNFNDIAAKDAVFEIYAANKARLGKLNGLGTKGDVRLLFVNAREAHSELVRQASGLAVEDLPERIREFREQARLLKQAFEDIHS